MTDHDLIKKMNTRELLPTFGRIKAAIKARGWRYIDFRNVDPAITREVFENAINGEATPRRFTLVRIISAYNKLTDQLHETTAVIQTDRADDAHADKISKDLPFMQLKINKPILEIPDTVTNFSAEDSAEDVLIQKSLETAQLRHQQKTELAQDSGVETYKRFKGLLEKFVPTYVLIDGNSMFYSMRNDTRKFDFKKLLSFFMEYNLYGNNFYYHMDDIKQEFASKHTLLTYLRYNGYNLVSNIDVNCTMDDIISQMIVKIATLKYTCPELRHLVIVSGRPALVYPLSTLREQNVHITTMIDNRRAGYYRFRAISDTFIPLDSFLENENLVMTTPPTAP